MAEERNKGHEQCKEIISLLEVSRRREEDYKEMKGNIEKLGKEIDAIKRNQILYTKNIEELKNNVGEFTNVVKQVLVEQKEKDKEQDKLTQELKDQKSKMVSKWQAFYMYALPSAIIIAIAVAAACGKIVFK